MKKLKTYLVKKDSTLPAAEDNWIVMNGYEFARFMETEIGKSRRKNFARLESLNSNDVDYIIECSPEQAKSIDRDGKRVKRNEMLENRCKCVSLEDVTSIDGALCGEEAIADDSGKTIEEILIAKENKKVLCEMINSLDVVSKEFISEMYFSDNRLTLRNYAAIHEISEPSAYKRKAKALKKLKIIFEKYGYNGYFFE